MKFEDKFGLFEPIIFELSWDKYEYKFFKNLKITDFRDCSPCLLAVATDFNCYIYFVFGAKQQQQVNFSTENYLCFNALKKGYF